MTLRSFFRLAALGMMVSGLAGCSALSSLGAASRPLDTFELTPLAAQSTRAGGGRRQLEVVTPTATGALTSDRIVVKPSPLRVEALPNARWVNEATELVQLLLVRSLANTGRFGLVTRGGAAAVPDYILLTDLEAFQAEIGSEGGDAVVVRTRLSLLRGSDDAVLATRSFANTVALPGTETEQVVAGFDRAMTAQLRDVTDWLLRNTGG